MMIWKNLEEVVTESSYYSRICSKKLRKITEKLSQNIRCVDQDSNRAPSRYDCGLQHQSGTFYGGRIGRSEDRNGEERSDPHRMTGETVTSLEFEQYDLMMMNCNTSFILHSAKYDNIMNGLTSGLAPQYLQ
jgi:hypothetical protein